MGKLTAKHLYEQGINSFVAENSSYVREKNIDDLFKGNIISIYNLLNVFIQADIIITSISADKLYNDKIPRSNSFT
jgi:glutamyl-tRNA reductase